MNNIDILELRRYIKSNLNTESVSRIVNDYELDFHLSGNLAMHIDDKCYNISKENIVFRKPGQRCYSIGNYDCYTLTVDFSGKVDKKEYKRIRNGTIQISDYDYLLKSMPEIIYSNHFDECVNIIKTMISGDVKQSKTLLCKLLYLVASDSYNVCENANTNTDIIHEIAEYITNNYSNRIKLRDLADKANYTENYFITKFKKIMGTSPTDYLISIRMKNAKSMLISTDYNIETISSLCGYTDVSLFIRQFKKRNKCTPKQFRDKNTQLY